MIKLASNVLVGKPEEPEGKKGVPVKAKETREGQEYSGRFLR